MPYLSLYRKYRPQTFAEVAGQDHVVQTLQNAIRFGHVASGYLFCGTRGVAKTTIARILSKCLNCVGPDGTLTSPQAEPCNACEPCRSIKAGQNVDVVEMDAASNRSVSDIAKLRESVQFGPMQSRYKVYIVDEAHQLSSDAKDAFLKTLEEPPANVVFILATTEAHAIPITIASRCQQFDFKRGSVQQLVDQCRRVLSAEDLTMPADALAIVARVADGSYRDALSLLDQVLAYKRDGLTAADVAAALGTVESEAIDAVLSAIAASDSAALFAHADSIYLQGKDVRQFLRALGARVRDLLYIRSGASTMDGGLETGDAGAKELANEFAPDVLVRMLEIVTAAERDTRHSDQHRLLLEMTLLKLASPRRSAPVDAQPSPSPPAPTRVDRAAPPKRAEPALRPAPEHATNSVAANAGPDAASAALEPAPALATYANPDEVLRKLRASWQEVIHNVQVHMPAGLALVRDASPVAVSGRSILLEFSQKANMVMMDTPRRREALEKVIAKILRTAEGEYKIKPVAAATPAPPAPASAPAAADAPTPILDAAVKEFGGKIIESPG